MTLFGCASPPVDATAANLLLLLLQLAIINYIDSIENLLIAVVCLDTLTKNNFSS